jgi:RHS repeat-associated protein
VADDFKVEQFNSTLLVERNYYPYGGSWAGPDYTSTTDEDIAPGLPGFTGQPTSEEQWWGWAFSDFGYRHYDVQLGRWQAPDPARQFASPYDYCGGDPVSRVDPDGRFVWVIPIALAVIGAYTGGSIANKTPNPVKWNYQSSNTWKGIGIGAAVGFGVGMGISAGLAANGITTNAQLFTKFTGTQGSYTGFGKFMANNFGMVVDATGNIGWLGIPQVTQTIIAGSGLAATAAAGTAAASAGGVALASAAGGAAAAGYGVMADPGMGSYRPDIDGHINFDEAMYWWRFGQGVSLFSDLETMDELWNRKRFLKKLRNKGLNKFSFNFFFDGISDQSMVFGTLNFIRKNSNHWLIKKDEYDFDQQPGRHLRNIATKFGGWINGPGEKYKIFFNGRFKIK